MSMELKSRAQLRKANISLKKKIRGLTLPIFNTNYKATNCKGIKDWCLRATVLEKTPESHLDSKEIKPVNPKGNQSWILIGRTDAEAETPVIWSFDVNSWLIGKVSDAGKDWGQKKRASEDEMAGWHHRRNGHELGQTSGDGEGQRGLVCCSPRGRQESDPTGQLNKNKNNNNNIRLL